jgi:hypothetical protein
MESEEELRKRIENLEKGLALERYQRDIDRQNARQAREHAESARKEKAYGNRTAFFFFAACALPFIIAWLK